MNIDHVTQKLDVIIELLRNQTGARSCQPSTQLYRPLLQRLPHTHNYVFSVRLMVTLDLMELLLLMMMVGNNNDDDNNDDNLDDDGDDGDDVDDDDDDDVDDDNNDDNLDDDGDDDDDDDDVDDGDDLELVRGAESSVITVSRELKQVNIDVLKQLTLMTEDVQVQTGMYKCKQVTLMTEDVQVQTGNTNN